MAAQARDLSDPRLKPMLQPVEQANQPDPRLPRTCFVTIGATAGFRPLLDEVASVDFRKRLRGLGYTKLVVQCGPDLEYFQTAAAQQGQESDNASTEPRSLEIESFAYTDDIGSMMRLASPSAGEGERGRRGYGVIISHAGSGSIMDALRYNAKLIAVPNESLMDNHQAELADEMQTQGFLVSARVGHLAEAVEFISTHTPKQWPPQDPHAGAGSREKHHPTGLYDAINLGMPPGPDKTDPQRLHIE
ncbi:uncharacterized protein B0I36DRAFT_365573 [Microdochium trichocladiopsis]|uniref:UDP-N-acetylglucosamine transferase subunit ALG13 n=1 Tax=Microdochium trichocladiopsis TaxID=1682393 RepID=A0A9P9BM51_9PEZI|nr:uncharacterized protein B0I36DRAFT_365573 [Microdochium trichocladiopsis]KAH7025933.1 hypothetical protein B0I36DRAFT_365573 [Microdochium trichocladiopsis]